jgi:hypothetical protein
MLHVIALKICYKLARVHRMKLTGILLNHRTFLLLADTKEKGLEVFLL